MRPDRRAPTALRPLTLERGANPHAEGSAISVGIVDGEPRLDLCYAEDKEADVDKSAHCSRFPHGLFDT